MEEKACLSCKKKIVNDKFYTSFKCPNCSKYELVRCGNCRSNAVKYKCPSCGFEGPN
ncbi:MAG TPA: zinc finger domain-containing protein [Candidatus Nanoarchaeia archaeon]|nr:zinc finger domain-containing protein [Candidatus Nanoarchaeia archaeon]